MILPTPSELAVRKSQLHALRSDLAVQFQAMNQYRFLGVATQIAIARDALNEAIQQFQIKIEDNFYAKRTSPSLPNATQESTDAESGTVQG